MAMCPANGNFGDPRRASLPMEGEVDVELDCQQRDRCRIRPHTDQQAPNDSTRWSEARRLRAVVADDTAS